MESFKLHSVVKFSKLCMLIMACIHQLVSGEFHFRKSSATLNEIQSRDASAASTLLDNPDDFNDQRNLQTLNYTGNNGGINAPLGLCEGDCDSDDECEGSLKCFQRSANETIPGCIGDDETWNGIDICYDPTTLVENTVEGTAVESSSKKFRLKLYWEKGYNWQGEKFERKWCVECTPSCKTGAKLKITHCSDSNDKFEFIKKETDLVQIKVSGSNLCWTLSGSKNILLKKCSSSNDKQLYSPGKGDFNGRRFELFTSTKNGCLTQHHHPKNNEIIFNDKKCFNARRDDTSYWNKY